MGLKKPHLQWNSLCASSLCFLTGKYLLVSGFLWFELKLIKEILCRTCSDCSVVQHLEGEGSPKKIKSFFLFRWNSQRASSNGCFTTLLLHVLPNAAASSPPVPSHHLSQLTLLLSGKNQFLLSGRNFVRNSFLAPLLLLQPAVPPDRYPQILFFFCLSSQPTRVYYHSYIVWNQKDSKDRHLRCQV